jgi:hypothetical protein
MSKYKLSVDQILRYPREFSPNVPIIDNVRNFWHLTHAEGFSRPQLEKGINPTRTRKKRRLREELETLCEAHDYIEFAGDARNYALHRVGQSLQYDVPPNKLGWLAPLRSQRVRIICLYRGPYRRLLRILPFNRMEPLAKEKQRPVRGPRLQRHVDPIESLCGNTGWHVVPV